MFADERLICLIGGRLNGHRVEKIEQRDILGADYCRQT
jgi:hypothetical protein